MDPFGVITWTKDIRRLRFISLIVDLFEMNGGSLSDIQKKEWLKEKPILPEMTL